jgi:Zn-dependent M28 family amino/carboxypeptidase
MRWLQTLVLLCLALLLTAFGCAGAKPVARTVPTFDGQRALDHVKTQCDFGPRAPGTAGRDACLRWLKTTLGALTTDVEDQAFTVNPPAAAALHGNNVIASFAGTGGGTVLMIGAHWDTRPVADEDPTPANRAQPVLGANDAGSGVAVLLELARVFQATPPPRPVKLVCLDLEDLGNLPATSGLGYQGFCVGSNWLAGHLGRHRPAEVIILDMIGDANLAIYQEGYSRVSHPNLVARLWQAASRLGYTQFRPQAGLTVTDDHKPFIDQGIPAVDLIDFDYPGPNSNRFWHTLDDTPDKCSAASLKAVGQTLLQVVYGG